MSALQGYAKGALRRKKLIASFVKQFQLTLENTRCFEFQFHAAKLSQWKCIIRVSTTQDYVQLMQLMASLVEYLKESHQNSISIIF